MAWRLDQAITHGEIDNTVEGRTTGSIWLAGRAEPLLLDLEGDCWRDLAGTRLRFTNPSPVAMVSDFAALDFQQSGIVGDMTASRKSKMPLMDGEGASNHKVAISYEWRNMLYLEWFGAINGRVLIESSEFILEISPPEWSMDEDAEEAQKLANLNAMRDFMAQVIRRLPPSTKQDSELDEFAWEELLQESDRLADAYQEVQEKYMDDVDSERKEAFVMGWDGLLGAMAEREEENGMGAFRQGRGGSSFESDGEESFSGENFEDEEDEEHPLQEQAQELAMRAMDVVSREALPGSPGHRLVSNLVLVSGKLTGVLHGPGGKRYALEKGLVLAVLKRCLNWLNEALGDCQVLMSKEDDADQLAALAHVRSTAFAIRDGITELRREIK